MLAGHKDTEKGHSTEEKLLNIKKAIIYGPLNISALISDEYGLGDSHEYGCSCFVLG